MGRFIGGVCLGLVMGLIFSPLVFPDGIAVAVQHLSGELRKEIPGSSQ